MTKYLWLAVIVVLISVLTLEFINPVQANDNNLLPLPCKAYGYDGSLKQQATLNSISNQSIIAAPNETVDLTVYFSINGPNSPVERQQLFFIYSWTPTWPPTPGYYFPLYDGVPGISPGVSPVLNVSFTLPNTPGVYYIWFCQGDTSNIATAVSMFNKPLSTPAAIKVTVTPRNSVAFLVSDTPGAKLALNLITAQAASEGLAAIGTEYYNSVPQDLEKAIDKLTLARPQTLWIICTGEDKTAIEKELRKTAYPGDVRYHDGKYLEVTLSDNASELDQPLSRGNTYKYHVNVINSGWLPLGTVIIEARISKPGTNPIWADTKSIPYLMPGASISLEFVFTIPQKIEGGEYVFDVQSTGYKGIDKSGDKHLVTMSIPITIASKSINSNILPVVVVTVTLGLIIAILISTRRRSTRLHKRITVRRSIAGTRKDND